MRNHFGRAKNAHTTLTYVCVFNTRLEQIKNYVLFSSPVSGMTSVDLVTADGQPVRAQNATESQAGFTSFRATPHHSLSKRGALDELHDATTSGTTAEAAHCALRTI